MGRINIGRVILGGLVAGVVVNLGEALLNLALVADQMAEVAKARNVSAEFSTNQLIGFNILGFLAGIFIAWVYAAIRPRFGPGPKAGVAAGLICWIGFSLIANTGLVLAAFLPAGLMTAVVAFQFVELALAGVVAGALYKEGTETPASSAGA